MLCIVSCLMILSHYLNLPVMMYFIYKNIDIIPAYAKLTSFVGSFSDGRITNPL